MLLLCSPALFVYLSLRQFAWAFDAAICVAYTVMVLGDGLTETFLRGHTLSGQKWTTIAITHICFLAVVLGVARMMHYLKITDESLTDAQTIGSYVLRLCRAWRCRQCLDLLSG